MDEKVKRMTGELFALLRVTVKDINFAMQIWTPFLANLKDGKQVDFYELHYAAKTMIRTLFGQLDAVGCLMRKLVVENANELALGLSNAKIAELSEKRYDRASDSVTDEPARFLPTLDSFKLALKHFPSVYGEDVEVDFGEPGWQSLKELKKARDLFTHPKGLADLVPLEALNHLPLAVLWAQATLKNVIGVCSREDANVSWPLIHTKGLPSLSKVSFPVGPKDIFNTEFYEQVGKSGSSRIAFATTMMRWMNDDTQRALDLCGALLKKINPRKLVGRKLETDDGLQFAARNLLRTFFAEVEGTISYATFVLKTTAENGEIHLSASDHEQLEADAIEDRLWTVSATWSREFGFKRNVDRESPEWKLFKETIGWRNRVTHPTNLMDYVILPSWFNSLMSLPLWYFSEVLKVMTFDPDR